VCITEVSIRCVHVCSEVECVLVSVVSVLVRVFRGRPSSEKGVVFVSVCRGSVCREDRWCAR